MGREATGQNEFTRSLTRLPTLNAALEGLVYFVFVVLAGMWAVRYGVIELSPVAPDTNIALLSLTTLILPALSEELAFRSWLGVRSGIWILVSYAAFILWHPVQVWLQLPFAHPAYVDPAFLCVVAALGLVCTLSRLRSGSIWPAVVIHWGVAALWRALFEGGGAGFG